MTNKQTGTSGLVERLRELLAKATPGPWVNFGGTVTDFDREFPGSMSMEWLPNGCGDGVNEKCDHDAELIVEVINALPELLDRLASLSPVPVDEVERLNERMRRIEYDMTHRRLVGDGFVGERKEVAEIICALRAALTASRPSDDGEVERLREALEPFADCCQYIEDDESDEEWAKFRLLVRDYRRARSALTPSPDIGGEG